MLKAYKVYYNLPGSSGNRMTVLAYSEENVPYYLEKKEPEFKDGTSYCKITRITQVPLTSVLVGELSMTELRDYLK